MPGRTHAAKQGRRLETSVENYLTDIGFESVGYSEWIKHQDRYGKELLLKHAPYTTIYGQKGFTEFLLRSESRHLNIRIECKWQQTAGSVDEKLPYLYLNCIECIEEDQVFIIIDGAGWKEGAIPWLRDAIAQEKYTDNANSPKTIRVFSLMEFMTWANNELGRK